jgi:hypothetical protein
MVVYDWDASSTLEVSDASLVYLALLNEVRCGILSVFPPLLFRCFSFVSVLFHVWMDIVS